MKLRIFFCVCFILLGLYNCISQNLNLQLQRAIKQDVSDFSIDNFGNIFLISSNNQLKKITPSGDSSAVFNDVKKYGTLHTIDATNPLKVLLYYKNFSTILVLDRFLNVRNTIDLRQQNIFRVKTIAQSFDNNIWIFDEQEAKLKKVGEDGKILQESVDFRLLFDTIPSPVQIVDQEGYVYLNDPSKGVFVFDIYGAYKNKLNFKGILYLQVIGKMLYGLSEDQFIIFDTKTFLQTPVSFPKEFLNARKIKITRDFIYVLNSDLKIYSYK